MRLATMYRRVIPATLMALGASGCAMGPELEVPIAQNSSERVAVRFTHAYQGKKGIQVTGMVRRKNFLLVRGHIHVEALGKGGALLAQNDAYLPKMVRAAYRTSNFATTLQVPDVSQVDHLTVEIRERDDK